MRSSLVLYAAVAAAVLPLTGCVGPLTQAEAAAVIERALAKRAASGMVNLTQGSIEVQLGDVRGLPSANNCRDAAGQPTELTDLKRYAVAGIIHLERPEPCKWVVTLSPETQGDVPFDDRLKPPTQRDYHAVSIMLSQWAGFEVTGIRQDGTRAQVEAEFRYRFTPTMHRLARARVVPALSSGCAYDVRESLIRCVRQLPMMIGRGAWKLDLPVIE
jgi:hypothetical protein